jgi:hypothetical protein
MLRQMKQVGPRQTMYAAFSAKSRSMP